MNKSASRFAVIVEGWFLVMQILVLNAGSSSLKHQLFASREGELARLSHGVIERIGERQGEFSNHSDALAEIFAGLERSSSFDPRQLRGIGHRVVHGGDSYDRSVVIDDQVIHEIRRAIPLAPLHNPPAIAGIESARALRPDLPQVAVFDTAFHQTIPPHAFRYALPTWCYERFRVRRYGMHGTSHAYVSRRAAELLGRRPDEVNVITLHLGNGASAAAVAGGRCVETSMGLTPLEGLVMGTRSGDLDPAVPLFLCREAGMTVSEVDRLLNRESGLTGLCGENDMRAVLSRRTGRGGRKSCTRCLLSSAKEVCRRICGHSRPRRCRRLHGGYRRERSRDSTPRMHGTRPLRDSA